jgi:hypothetical protein
MSLYHELKRRNVHRMAALYMAAAWLVMQVVDVVEGKLPLPDWMGSAVLAVLPASSGPPPGNVASHNWSCRDWSDHG